MGVDGGPGKGYLILRFFKYDGQFLFRRDHGHIQSNAQNNIREVAVKVVSVDCLYVDSLSPLAGIHSLTAEARFHFKF